MCPCVELGRCLWIATAGAARSRSSGGTVLRLGVPDGGGDGLGGDLDAGLAQTFHDPSRKAVFDRAGHPGYRLSIALSHWAPLTVAIVFLMGFAAVVFMTSANRLLQLSVPSDMRGRVIGLYVLPFWGTALVGSYLVGHLAERANGETAVLATAAICAAGIVTALSYDLRTSGPTFPGKKTWDSPAQPIPR